MVHKRYVLKNGRLHGPYYYESYREGKHIRKKYLGTKLSNTLPYKFYVFLLVIGAILLLVLGFIGYRTLTGKIIDENVQPASSAAGAESSAPSSEDTPSQASSSIESAQPAEQQEPAQEESGGAAASENSAEGAADVSGAQPPAAGETEDNGNGESTSSSQEQPSDETSSGPPASLLDENFSVSPPSSNESVVNVTVPPSFTNETLTNVTGNETTPPPENVSANITLPPPITNETFTNVTIGNETLLNETILNQTITNETLLNETFINQTILNETRPIFNVTSLLLLKQIPGVRIPRNGSAELNLLEYFSGAERYSFNSTNITFILKGNFLILAAEEGFRGARRGIVTAISGNESVQSNEFLILVSNGAVVITTSREKIKVGELVRWVKNISVEIPDNFTVALPAEASNITITKSALVEEGAGALQRSSLFTGYAIASDSSQEEFFLFRWMRKFFNAFIRAFGTLTGRAIDVPISIVNVSFINENQSAIQILFNVSAPEQYVIEYYTPAPLLTEERVSRGKRVIVSAPSNWNYTDVIVGTNLSNLSAAQIAILKVYWHRFNVTPLELLIPKKRVKEIANVSIVEQTIFEVEQNATGSIEDVQPSSNESANSSIEPPSPAQNTSLLLSNSSENSSAETEGASLLIGRVIGGELFVGNETNLSNAIPLPDETKIIIQEMPFDAYDTDGDGLFDYLEWVVPHLSNQTFVIELTKAEHLDENRSLVADAYEQVHALDGNSVSIPSSHFLRVYFERNLSAFQDITFYASANATNASVTVYEQNGSLALVTLSVAANVSSHRAFLSALNGTQNTFDLGAFGGEVVFDYVVEPMSTNCTNGAPCIFVRNTSGENKAIFDSEGNVDLAGKVYVNSSLAPTGASFIIQNASQYVAAWINTSGDLHLRGTIIQQTNTYCNVSSTNFVIRNSAQQCVVYINRSGDLWLRGTLSENVLF